MSPDRYTKVVLTIIAAALVWLCVRDLVPTVQARASDQEQVALYGIDVRHPLPVKIVGIERGQWTQKVNALDTVQERHPWQPIEVVTR